uniref:Ig-like domain-containing protein n=1 Tax=Amphilophus citrinellus TaxID=61819 RepID=A0A3Q0RMJ5_AMPCI
IMLYGPELRCPSTYTADEFTPYTLNCIAEGFPKPDTVWYKDNEEVDLPEKLTRRDAGQYVITASNNHSNVSVTVEIFVQCKSFIHTSSMTDCICCMAVFLKCASRGYPRLNYTWHYYQTANVMEENEDGVSLLKIHHANADNMGSYTCDAWNSKGNVSKTVRVTVIEDYLPLIAGFVAVTVIAISIIFLFIYSIYYKNTKMRQYSFENPKFNTHNGNVAHSNGDLQFPMTKLSKQHICA